MHWEIDYTHFSNFVKSKCTFGEVNMDLYKRFRTYLLSAKQLKHTEYKVSFNSTAGYYSKFRGLLKIAYRDKLFREITNDFLEEIEYEDVKLLSPLTFHSPNCYWYRYLHRQ